MKWNYAPREAFKEARMVILGALLIAVAYNLFADTRVPWVRELPNTGETVSAEDFLGTSTSTTTTTTAPVPLGPDTAHAVVNVPGKIDTAHAVNTGDSAKLAAAKKLREQAVIDSTAKARQLAAHVKDSLAKAIAPAKPKEIGTATAKQIFDSKQALFIDARPAADFSAGHIPGAMSVYAEEFQNHIPELLPLLSKNPDQPIVAYCGGGLCELSHELADQLVTLGFKRVVVYTGGTTEWTASNYPFTGTAK